MLNWFVVKETAVSSKAQICSVTHLSPSYDLYCGMGRLLPIMAGVEKISPAVPRIIPHSHSSGEPVRGKVFYLFWSNNTDKEILLYWTLALHVDGMFSWLYLLNIWFYLLLLPFKHRRRLWFSTNLELPPLWTTSLAVLISIFLYKHSSILSIQIFSFSLSTRKLHTFQINILHWLGGSNTPGGIRCKLNCGLLSNPSTSNNFE